MLISRAFRVCFYFVKEVIYEAFDKGNRWIYDCTMGTRHELSNLCPYMEHAFQAQIFTESFVRDTKKCSMQQSEH